MFRYSIKSLLYLTTMVAGYSLYIRDDRPNLAGMVGYLLYGVLLLWAAYKHWPRTRMMAEESEPEKHAE